MNRRQLLGAMGSLGLALLAGCSSADSPETTTEAPNLTNTAKSTTEEENTEKPNCKESDAEYMLNITPVGYTVYAESESVANSIKEKMEEELVNRDCVVKEETNSDFYAVEVAAFPGKMERVKELVSSDTGYDHIRLGLTQSTNEKIAENVEKRISNKGGIEPSNIRVKFVNPNPPEPRNFFVLIDNGEEVNPLPAIGSINGTYEELDKSPTLYNEKHIKAIEPELPPKKMPRFNLLLSNRGKEQYREVLQNQILPADPDTIEYISRFNGAEGEVRMTPGFKKKVVNGNWDGQVVHFLSVSEAYTATKHMLGVERDVLASFELTKCG